jgi:hypothetical protein
MATQPLARFNTGWVVLVAVIALGVLADGVVTVAHLRASTHSQAPVAAQAGSNNSQHPCNHGFYVSQAAHAKNGGAFVKQIAQGQLGKNGNCAAPLPAPKSQPKPSSSEADG